MSDGAHGTPSVPLAGLGWQLALIWGVSVIAGALLGRVSLDHGNGGMLMSGSVLLAVSALATALLFRRLIGAVGVLASFAQSLAKGELVARVDAAACGPFASLAETMNGMARTVAGVFLAFGRMAQELSSVAGESRRNASGGDEGVRRQRDVTISSSATLEELSVSLAAASDNALAAQQVADASGAMAEAGLARVAGLALGVRQLAETVVQTTESAERLGLRSQEIDQIVELIADIAGQTNLLALNAAIEAARAGEHGRGFSVVADEVRKLAERTSQATREVAERIEGIRCEVAAMVTAMSETRERTRASLGEAGLAEEDLRRLAGNARQTLALVRDIACASREQSLAGQNIARDIEQVSHLADANEQLVHENSELSRYLDELTRQLAGTLDRYRYE